MAPELPHRRSRMQGCPTGDGRVDSGTNGNVPALIVFVLGLAQARKGKPAAPFVRGV